MTRRKRRTSPLTRERQRQTMLELFADDEAREARIEAMQAGRRRARSPERLAEVEAAQERLGEEFKSLPPGHARRAEIIREIRGLGREWASLKYGGRNTDDPTTETRNA
jgi:hypothetical protein